MMPLETNFEAGIQVETFCEEAGCERDSDALVALADGWYWFCLRDAYRHTRRVYLEQKSAHDELVRQARVHDTVQRADMYFALISAGRSQISAAAEAGVHVNTAYRWHHDQAMRAAVATKRERPLPCCGGIEGKLVEDPILDFTYIAREHMPDCAHHA